MREIRPYGSEGGAALRGRPYPYQEIEQEFGGALDHAPVARAQQRIIAAEAPVLDQVGVQTLPKR